VAAALILLVDDDDQIRRLFRRKLEINGFEVIEASSVEQALRCLGKSDFDLIVLDLSMPAADGYDVLGHLRTQDLHIPTIVVSGVMPENTLAMATFMGASKALDKVSALNDLVPAIRSVLWGGASG
jgi:DNA-binding response OmpR family regulator